MNSADEREFDLWGNDTGGKTARESIRRFVDDRDAPYGFSRHLQRVSANSAREALSKNAHDATSYRPD